MGGREASNLIVRRVALCVSMCSFPQKNLLRVHFQLIYVVDFLFLTQVHVNLNKRKNSSACSLLFLHEPKKKWSCQAYTYYL